MMLQQMTVTASAEGVVVTEVDGRCVSAARVLHGAGLNGLQRRT